MKPEKIRENGMRKLWDTGYFLVEAPDVVHLLFVFV